MADSCPYGGAQLASRHRGNKANGYNTGKFWTVLVQRAYLQHCGVDYRVENWEDWPTWGIGVHNYRSSWRALRALSGLSRSHVDSEYIRSSESTRTAEDMRHRVVRGDMMIAGGTGHAYGIVDVYQDSGGNWKVVLYNPWGGDEPHQSMSRDHGTRTNDGEITLDWNVFCNNFDRVHFTDY